ncbi:transcription initiation factor TFIID subunit 9 [Drosophila miranda]|uniref:transcription initiation factor TFIID subunit 9 n=1 Tax=Drosophila miranda TaxID=7229 RepID=UPI0007E7FC32|nr:transcription initiation factor TFIID subunit 9 [Drosophila miranda]
MAEKAEKAKINAQIKHVPKDAQVIMSILKELNVQEYEPRVVNQLLEFTFRYVTCILDDAKVYANHARKKTIDLEDVRLATDMALDKSFTGPLPRHTLSKVAEIRNSMPLPPIKPHCGLRLPPDRYCLTGVNYKLRATNQAKKMPKSALEARALKTVIKPVASANGPKRAHSVVAKQQVVTIPKPVIKFTTTTKNVPGNANTKTDTSTGGDMKMEVDSDAVAVGSIPSTSASAPGVSSAVKREREEEEFEFVAN